MDDLSKMNYIVAYMGGAENEGVTEDWVPCQHMEEAVRFARGVRKEHEFWKYSICKILETHES